MAYEVTATRRRPQHFSDLIGQDFVAETLKNSIKTEQIAHAYLFAGPRGCGKTSSARILAKALNCQASQNPTCEPCGQCESCKAITNSSSLDVIEIDGASNTSVNDVRQIKDEVMFPPNSSRYKIYIIDEVHMLSTSAFNALLKTIEEPPPYVIFIFATTELQKVPATIKSRCQQFNFRLVPVEKVKNLLAQAASELNIQADDEALYWIAKESGGSIRDSYTLFDQVAAFSEGHITYEKIRDKLGLLGVDRLNSIFESCANGNSEQAINQLDEFLQSGISIEQLISNSTEYLRSLLLIKNGITKEALLGQAAERYSSLVLNSWNTIQTERALSIFLQLYRDIRYSLSPRYELELSFSRLCWLKQYVSPSEVKQAIDQAHSLLVQANPNAINANVGASPVVTSVNNTTPVSTPTENSYNAANYEQPIETPQVTQAASVIPNGMPQFSALEKIEQQPQQEQNPFYKGGALPPNQTAATTENANTNVNADISADTNYDDWSNTETPPESEYSPEPESDEEQEYVATDSYEEEAYSAEAMTDIHNNEAIFTAPDGFTISVTKIFGTIVSELSVNDALLASSLMQTGRWELVGNKIVTKTKSIYQKGMLEQNIQKIVSFLSKVCHSQMNFEVTLEEETSQTKQADFPPQVKIVCSAFKGSILGADGGN